MAAPRFDRTTVLALLILYFVWGSTYLVMRFAVEGLPPMMMGGTRFVLAGLVLMAVLRSRGEALPTLKQWLWSVPIGACFFLFANGFVAIAEVKIGSGVAAVVCATSPVLAAAMAPLFRERTTLQEWVGLVIGLAGVVVLSYGADLRADLLSTVLLFIAPLSWSVGSMLSRRLPLPKGLIAAGPQMVAGGCLMFIAAAVRGEHVPESPPLKAVLSLLYLVVFGSLVAFTAYTWLLKHTRPAVAMSYAYVNPAVAVFLGVLFGDEKLQSHTVVATAIITVATVIMVSAKTKKPAVAEAPAAEPAPQRS